MLQRQSVRDVVYYRSPLMHAAGVRHAFSTRIGGISPAPFDSLNLGNPNGCEVQDSYDRIWENYALLLRAIECNDAKPLRVHQVHGCEVRNVEAGNDFDTSAKADAIVTRDVTRPISVRVADCVPVLLASGDGKAVAAVHAGWRGVIAGVVPEAIKSMGAADIIAAIGPCIGEDAFEVGEDVLLEFQKCFGDRAPIRRVGNGKGRVDLRAAIALQLADAGVSLQRIDMTDRCTVTHREEFFSHRRDRGVTGRMAAVICPNP